VIPEPGLEHGWRATSWPPSTRLPASHSTSFRELVSLRDAGVVTAEEFATKSIELVRRL